MRINYSLLTVTELGELARRIRIADERTEEYMEAVEAIAQAALILQESGALQQLIWWEPLIEPEAPPHHERVVN